MSTKRTSTRSGRPTTTARKAPATRTTSSRPRPTSAGADQALFWDRARDAQRQVKREAILKVAAELFNQRGFSATSLVDVARRLKVTKTALYYYVKDKEDLIFNCYLRAAEDSSIAFETARTQGRNGLEKVALVIQAYMTRTDGPYAMMSETAALTPEHRRIIYEREHAKEILFRGFIEEGVKDGSIAPCDAKLVELWIMSAISWAAKWFSPHGERSAEEVGQAFIHLVTNGLRPR